MRSWWMKTMAKKNNEKSKNKSSKSSERKTSTGEDKYIVMKKDQIKDAVNKGNYAKAKRHATEIRQYLGQNNSELPIDDVVETFE